MLGGNLVFPHHPAFVGSEASVGQSHLFQFFVVIVQGQIVDGQAIAGNKPVA